MSRSSSGETSVPVRLAWLDLLRGVAALVVVLHHATYYFTPRLRAGMVDWFDPGLYGVLVFFLVSGYIVPPPPPPPPPARPPRGLAPLLDQPADAYLPAADGGVRGHAGAVRARRPRPACGAVGIRAGDRGAGARDDAAGRARRAEHHQRLVDALVRDALLPARRGVLRHRRA